MTDMSADAKLPRALSLAVHEFRTPLSVVGGYLRMVLKDPTDTLNDRYRSMLGEAEKSCARIVALVAEMSDLSALESGKATLKRALFDLRPVLGEAIAQLPGVPERTVEVELTTGQGPAMIEGDSPRLKTALAALLHGLRRELVSTDRLVVRERTGDFHGKPASWIAVADADHIDVLASASDAALTPFDHWREGVGFSIVIACRIIEGHGGAVWSLAGSPKAGDPRKSTAVVMLPLK